MSRKGNCWDNAAIGIPTAGGTVFFGRDPTPVLKFFSQAAPEVLLPGRSRRRVCRKSHYQTQNAGGMTCPPLPPKKRFFRDLRETSVK
jgi:hypothetical protein